MALNPQYEDIGKGFVQQYYALFDDPIQRPNLVHLFNVSTINLPFANIILFIDFLSIPFISKINLFKLHLIVVVYMSLICIQVKTHLLNLNSFWR